MPHFIIVLHVFINFSLINKCLFLRNIEPLIILPMKTLLFRNGYFFSFIIIIIIIRCIKTIVLIYLFVYLFTYFFNHLSFVYRIIRIYS